MSESRAGSPELSIIPGRVSFTEAQLIELQATVVNEIAPVMRAKEIYDKTRELTGVKDAWWNTWWDSPETVLNRSFIDFFENGERIKHEGKVLDISELHMPLDMTLGTEHSAIHGRNLGDFNLGAINLENGQVVITSVVKRDKPDDLESENESWFSFVVDPNMPEQAINIVYFRDDYDGERAHQALLPVLAGETDAPMITG